MSSIYFRYFLLSPLGKGQGPSFEQTWIPFTQGSFVTSWVEIGSVFLKKEIFKFWQLIFAISQLSPFRKENAFHVNKLETPSPKDALCQIWLKLAQLFWRRRLLNFVNVLLLFLIYNTNGRDRFHWAATPPKPYQVGNIIGIVYCTS